MTIREANTQSMLILGSITVSGQSNILKLAEVFRLMTAVEDKLADLEKEGAENGGGV